MRIYPAPGYPWKSSNENAFFMLLLAASVHGAMPESLVWDSPSTNSWGSMPIGNGYMGANVWVEPSGDLVLLLSKTDAWDEVARLCKLGRVRINLPCVKNFRQELRVADGEIVIHAGETTTRLWIDANRPVVRVEMTGTKEFMTSVTHETWRTKERQLKGGEVRAAFGQQDSPEPLRVAADTVLDGQQDRLVFYHRNPTSVWEKNLRLQFLDELANPADDPLLHRTFGGLARGENLVSDGKGKLVAGKPAKQFVISIHALTERTSTPEAWVEQATKQATESDRVPLADARAAHAKWWRDFWERSWIVASGSPEAERVARGYALQRWMFACAGRGAMPIKFNGSIFNVDCVKPIKSYIGVCAFDADFREWGGPYWWQNTRLSYWPMLAAGDYDLMQPMFKMYLDALPLRDTLPKS